MSCCCKFEFVAAESPAEASSVADDTNPGLSTPDATHVPVVAASSSLSSSLPGLPLPTSAPPPPPDATTSAPVLSDARSKLDGPATPTLEPDNSAHASNPAPTPPPLPSTTVPTVHSSSSDTATTLTSPDPLLNSPPNAPATGSLNAQRTMSRIRGQTRIPPRRGQSRRRGVA